MGKTVVFVHPIENVGVLYDLLMQYTHSNFPVIDKRDGDILYGTISRNALCTLLTKRAFGHPVVSSEGRHNNNMSSTQSHHIEHNCDYVDVGAAAAGGGRRFLPLVQWNVIGSAYPKYPSVQDVQLSEDDRHCFVDLRPYTNTSPYSTQETCSVTRVYHLFRSLGARFLVVVNKYNQCVGTITRDDLTPEALAQNMLTKGKHA